jgi:hypothetical protein
MQTKIVSDSSDALISLIETVRLSYQPPPRPKKCGKQPDFSDCSFLLLTVAAVVLQTFSDSALHRLLRQEDALRRACGFVRVPHRTQIGRRLKSLLCAAEEQICCLGKQLLAEFAGGSGEPAPPQVSATDGRMYQSSGAKWHKKDRLAGVIPAGLRSVDCESSWSKSHYRGWVQGYRLVLQTLVFPEPVPLFAVWRENSRSEAAILLDELQAGRLQVTAVNLGDVRLAELGLPEEYRQQGGWLLTPKEFAPRRRTWKHDLYDYRKETVELLFQRIIQAFDIKECPVKGKAKNGAFVLASVWLYQICFLKNHRENKPLADVKEQIEKARWRIKF